MTGRPRLPRKRSLPDEPPIHRSIDAKIILDALKPTGPVDEPWLQSDLDEVCAQQQGLEIAGSSDWSAACEKVEAARERLARLRQSMDHLFADRIVGKAASESLAKSMNALEAGLMRLDPIDQARVPNMKSLSVPIASGDMLMGRLQPIFECHFHRRCTSTVSGLWIRFVTAVFEQFDVLNSDGQPYTAETVSQMWKRKRRRDKAKASI